MGHCKMRSGSPALAQEELHWSLTALLLLGLMGVDALVSHKRDPSRLSAAEALDKVRFAMKESPPGAPEIRPATLDEIACAKRSYKVA